MESTSGGGGEVHAHLSAQPDKGEGMSGKFDADDGATNFTRRVRERAEGAIGSARDRGSDLRDRVGDAAHRARSRAEDLFDQAEQTLESRTGVMQSARSNPLAALGIAFAVGFLLAGDGSPESDARHPTAAKAKNQIKGAIMGGVSAAISQQLRTFIEEQGGIGALLAAIGVPVPGGRPDPYFTPDDDLEDV